MRTGLRRRVELLRRDLMAFATPFLDEKLLRDRLKSRQDEDPLRVYQEQQPYVLYHMRRRGYPNEPDYSEIRYYLKALSEDLDPNPPRGRGDLEGEACSDWDGEVKAGD